MEVSSFFIIVFGELMCISFWLDSSINSWPQPVTHLQFKIQPLPLLIHKPSLSSVFSHLQAFQPSTTHTNSSDNQTQTHPHWLCNHHLSSSHFPKLILTSSSGQSLSLPIPGYQQASPSLLSLIFVLWSQHSWFSFHPTRNFDAMLVFFFFCFALKVSYLIKKNVILGIGGVGTFCFLSPNWSSFIVLD